MASPVFKTGGGRHSDGRGGFDSHLPPLNIPTPLTTLTSSLDPQLCRWQAGCLVSAYKAV